MVTVPALVWRGGFIGRALMTGGAVGLCVGALAWLDSGFVITGVIVTVVVGTFYGVWMARRMARYWPGADTLSADDRVAVARATRRGQRLADARLSGAAADYARGMKAAAEEARPLRWLLMLVLIVAVAAAVADAVFGSWGNAVVSVVYLAALLAEMFWWPRQQARLLANAHAAAAP
ncbi:hypothetical protein [Mycobacterium sp. E740]|uniref:hypothetical protein n=1 Tax=Mycobacterium sp. E740 TaxID=1834149 RepID=UPI0007FBE345|nr:hypothetical protein [Mycobacterium sp. E740]OBI83584.1 hypothetical protein A5663_12745 [Mycobacterium sp. E740]